MSLQLMKYIIIKGPITSMPILFPSLISHDVMAKQVKHIGEPLSAGFVDLMDGRLSAYSKSSSLELKSRPEDSEIINRFLEEEDF